MTNAIGRRALHHHIPALYSGAVDVRFDLQQFGGRDLPVSTPDGRSIYCANVHLPEIEPCEGLVSAQRKGKRIPATRAKGVVSEVEVDQSKLCSIGSYGRNHRLPAVHTELAPSHVQASKARRGLQRSYNEPHTSASLAANGTRRRE